MKLPVILMDRLSCAVQTWLWNRSQTPRSYRCVGRILCSGLQQKKAGQRCGRVVSTCGWLECEMAESGLHGLSGHKSKRLSAHSRSEGEVFARRFGAQKVRGWEERSRVTALGRDEKKTHVGIVEESSSCPGMLEPH